MRVVVIVVIITSIPVAVIFFSPFSTPQALAFVKPLSLCEWGRERESLARCAAPNASWKRRRWALDSTLAGYDSAT